MGAGRAQGFTTALTDIDSTPQEYLGMIRQDFNADYKYVKFTGTTAVAVGDPLCYVITDTNFQTVDGANSVNGAGVAVAVHASGSVTYGWIQIRGLAVITTLTSGTAGQQVTNTGAAAAALKVAAAVTDQVVGTVGNVTNKSVLLDYPN